MSESFGGSLGVGERPQAVVRRQVWQAARSLGAWTLVGCSVAPAFELRGFELAPPGWEPRLAAPIKKRVSSRTKRGTFRGAGKGPSLRSG